MCEIQKYIMIGEVILGTFLTIVLIICGLLLIRSCENNDHRIPVGSGKYPVTIS